MSPAASKYRSAQMTALLTTDGQPLDVAAVATAFLQTTTVQAEAARQQFLLATELAAYSTALRERAEELRRARHDERQNVTGAAIRVLELALRPARDRSRRADGPWPSTS